MNCILCVFWMHSGAPYVLIIPRPRDCGLIKIADDHDLICGDDETKDKRDVQHLVWCANTLNTVS